MKRLSILLSIILSLVTGVFAKKVPFVQTSRVDLEPQSRMTDTLPFAPRPTTSGPASPVRFIDLNRDDAVRVGLADKELLAGKGLTDGGCLELVALATSASASTTTDSASPVRSGSVTRLSGGANNVGVYRVSQPGSPDVVVKVTAGESLTPCSEHRSRNNQSRIAEAAATPIIGAHGRLTPPAVAPIAVVSHKGISAEIMPCAPGIPLYDIFKNSDKEELRVYCDIGLFIGNFHQSGITKFEEDPALWRSSKVHGDGHTENIFYDEAEKRCKFIDLGRLIYAIDNPITPFFDVMYLIFVSLFYHKVINKPANKFKFFASNLNAFLKGYIESFPQERQRALCNYLTQLIDLWLDTAFLMLERGERMVTHFLQSPIYTRLDLSQRKEKVDDKSVSPADTAQICFNAFFQNQNSRNQDSTKEMLQQKLKYLKRHMLRDIRAAELSASEDGFDIQYSGAAAAAAAVSTGPVMQMDLNAQGGLALLDFGAADSVVQEAVSVHEVSQDLNLIWQDNLPEEAVVDIIRNMSRNKRLSLAAFYKKGESLGEFHQEHMQNFDQAPEEWLSRVRGYGNISHEAQTPFFDVEMFVFKALFEEYITGSCSNFISGANAFLQGYVNSFPVEKRRELCAELIGYMNPWIETAITLCEDSFFEGNERCIRGYDQARAFAVIENNFHLSSGLDSSCVNNVKSVWRAFIATLNSLRSNEDLGTIRRNFADVKTNLLKDIGNSEPVAGAAAAYAGPAGQAPVRAIVSPDVMCLQPVRPGAAPVAQNEPVATESQAPAVGSHEPIAGQKKIVEQPKAFCGC